jgi:hypothetical protein
VLEVYCQPRKTYQQSQWRWDVEQCSTFGTLLNILTKIESPAALARCHFTPTKVAIFLLLLRIPKDQFNPLPARGF